MRAVRIHAFDSAMHLEEVPDPIPADGQVLVRVKAAGVNPLDKQISQGYHFGAVPPFTLGVEGAGIVESDGPRQGERVMFWGYYGIERDGTWADRVVVDEADLLSVPDWLSDTQAAALPLVWSTAAGALDASGFSRGMKVLIPAVGGSVGNAAVQLAKAKGASCVITTASSEAKAEYARRQGYDNVVDLSSQNLVEAVHELVGPDGVDVVIDTVGGPVFHAALGALGRGGTVVTIGSPAGDELLASSWGLRRNLHTVRGWNISELLSHPERKAETLAWLLELARTGSIVPIVAGAYRLEDAPTIVDRLETERPFGKFVITT